MPAISPQAVKFHQHADRLEGGQAVCVVDFPRFPERAGNPGEEGKEGRHIFLWLQTF